MMLDIIFEDPHILVVRKQAGIESQGGKSLSMDMVSLIKNEMMFRQRKAGIKKEPYVGVIHRLDRPVSGVMVYAKTQKAAAVLSRQVKLHMMQKRYYALLCAMPPQKQGILRDFLVHDKKTNKTYISKNTDPAAKEAILQYQIVDRNKFQGFDFIRDTQEQSYYLADILLMTGRHHQIRVQFANIGCPLWGDVKYNPQWNYSQPSNQIALCAYELTFTHPITNKIMSFHY